MYLIKKVSRLYEVGAETNPIFENDTFVVSRSNVDLYETIIGKEAVYFAEQCQKGFSPLHVKVYLSAKIEKLISNQKSTNPDMIYFESDFALMSKLDNDFTSYTKYTNETLPAYFYGKKELLPSINQWITIEEYLSLYLAYEDQPKTFNHLLNQLLYPQKKGEAI